MVSQGDARWEVECLRFGFFGAFPRRSIISQKILLSLYCFYFLANFIDIGNIKERESVVL